MSAAPRSAMMLVLLSSGAITAALTGLLARGLSLDNTHPALAVLVLALFAATTMMLAAAAIIALAGLLPARPRPLPEPDTKPGKCAVLWLICGEPPEPLANRVADMLAGLARSGQSRDCDIFILSDTQGTEARMREQAALAAVLDQITYRNRATPTGRKPGNLQDWIDTYGATYESFLLLDADSGFSAERLQRMRARMAASPALGLLQTGIRLRPAQSRFGRMQRLSSRLSGTVFANGLERVCGDTGNFWGHNALIRTRAFAEISPLPPLPGRAPLGGPILSHDFIEAACLRRNGWQIAICPDSRGSFEDAPETMAAHLRRDRRWAQGNLQHMRLLGAPGLHPTSRLHLAAGILSYLQAPIWLLLVLLMGSGAAHAGAGVIWPLLGVVMLLLAPKLAGLFTRPDALLRPARRRVLLRALWAELALTTLYAPLGMFRRSAFVAAILSGRTTGWVPSGLPVGQSRQPGLPEVVGGGCIILAVAIPQFAIAGAAPAGLAALLILPVTLPLLCAPLLWRWFDATRSRDPVARYYDQSTRRFLAVGGSGKTLAIHRPLWAEGVNTPVAAAAHVNALIARAAEDALGRAPDRVLDLGCGVGGTLFALARAWPEAALAGVTISAEQVRLARAHAQARTLEGRCTFLRSDFTLPMTLPRADLVIAVESHVHAPDAQSFLQAALRQLAPGGVLVLVDDMLARREDTLSAPQAMRVAQFRKGWRLGHVPDCAGLIAQAEGLGLRLDAQQDLTALLRLDRWRDRALRVAGPFADRLGLAGMPFFGNMIGGNALTESYREGVMQYSLLVMRSPGATRTKPVPLPGRAVAC